MPNDLGFFSKRGFCAGLDVFLVPSAGQLGASRKNIFQLTRRRGGLGLSFSGFGLQGSLRRGKPNVHFGRRIVGIPSGSKAVRRV